MGHANTKHGSGLASTPNPRHFNVTISTIIVIVMSTRGRYKCLTLYSICNFQIMTSFSILEISEKIKKKLS